MPSLTNSKHEAFAQALAKGKSQADAYAEAGYAPSEPHASRLARNGKVVARVAELAEKSALRAELDVARILKELSRVGLSDLRGLFKEDGSIKKPSEWDDDLAAAISSIEVVSKGSGDGPVEYVSKVKLWDKNAALEKIGKHFSMFIERQEVTVTHRFAEMSDDELRFEAVALVARTKPSAKQQ